MKTRCLEINGLTVELVHQPDASQAAALIQVGAGSHDEPDRWPGLAHLLEHLLFTGSTGWPDEGRLMSWIQTQGGRVNATTLARRSAFFLRLRRRCWLTGWRGCRIWSAIRCLIIRRSARKWR